MTLSPAELDDLTCGDRKPLLPGSAHRVTPSRQDPLAPTLFHQPWWLTIATQGAVATAEVSTDGKPIGRLAYTVSRKGGVSLARMPELTHFLGPAIDEGEGNATTRALRRLTVTRALIAQLPRLSAIEIKLHRGVTDAIPFQMEGFATAVQFTHTLAPSSMDALWRGLRDKTRNVIRKAQKDHVVEDITDPDAFVRLYNDNLAALDRDCAVDLSICRDLIAACLVRNQGRMRVARAADGTPAAAIFFAWDATTAYYLLSTRSPSSGNGVIPLLLWDAIQSAASQNLTFDFDGLASEGSVLLFAGFGAVAEPRYVVSRTTRAFRAIREIRRLLRAENAYTGTFLR